VVHCTSLKSNTGHLEASAAAAGLASLVLVPLGVAVAAANAQLHRCFLHVLVDPKNPFHGGYFRLNAHLLSIVSPRSSHFWVPVELAARWTCCLVSEIGPEGLLPGRLSSFGFSGTIAHGAFSSPTSTPRRRIGALVKVDSQYRGKIAKLPGRAQRLYMILM